MRRLLAAAALLVLATPVCPGPAGAAEAPPRVREAGKLVIATFPNYPPLTFRDPATNARQGFDVDLGEAIGRALGVKVEWAEMAFVQMIPGLQTGRADLAMDGIGDLPARREVVDMVDYMQTGARFFVAAGSEAKAPQDLCGKRVGASRSTSWPADMAAWSARFCEGQGRPPLQVVGTEGSIDTRTQLRSGRLDGGVQGDETMAWFLKTEPGAYVPIGERFTTVLVGIPVAKTEPALRDAVRAALAGLLADGTYAALLRKWGLEPNGVAAVTVNGAP